MASRCRSISKPALSFLKSASKGPNRPVSANFLSCPIPSYTRIPRAIGSLESLLPFHSAVSSARLTSRLGIEGSRSLSQGKFRRCYSLHWSSLFLTVMPLVKLLSFHLRNGRWVMKKKHNTMKRED